MSEVRRVVTYGGRYRKGEELWGDGLDPNANYEDVLSLWKFVKLCNCDMCTYL